MPFCQSSYSKCLRQTPSAGCWDISQHCWRYWIAGGATGWGRWSVKSLAIVPHFMAIWPKAVRQAVDGRRKCQMSAISVGFIPWGPWMSPKFQATLSDSCLDISLSDISSPVGKQTVQPTSITVPWAYSFIWYEWGVENVFNSFNQGRYTMEGHSNWSLLTEIPINFLWRTLGECVMEKAGR